ncbi:ABC transporter substrate-binding protein [Bradyrhizobium sp. CB3481]|uniref:ABC transporter substrate-binding protein n=1 Tax=Bradyrhizobium sp. CB3481 TaxID=3039158 RepID=UPI0024B08461|nr:ABC transporter substrate-binding protein [Bradyrhizobium sp. CB3481]WFU14596.1 ABC transporter substrate-binding protein [Bradyrhizobium sp. CB3481]
MGVLGKANAQTSGAVVVCSYGGQVQDALRKAAFEPFERTTGIKVVEATGPSPAKLRAMSMSNNIEWDVVQIFAPDFLALANGNLLEKINYNALDGRTMSQINKQFVHPFGVGAATYSLVIAFNTKYYPIGKHPRTWSDVWDVQKFPGPRILPAATSASPPNECALLADGVLPQHLYPLDLERSYRGLSKIKPHVLKWSSGGAMAPQALADGEAHIGFASQGRIAQLKLQGAAVDFEWNQGFYTADFWAIPKGAKNVGNALKFIEFVSRPEPVVEWIRLMGGGSPVNAESLNLMTPELAKQTVTYPDNLKQQIWLDAEWWAKKVDGKTNKDRNIEMWNTWLQTGNP